MEPSLEEVREAWVMLAEGCDDVLSVVAAEDDEYAGLVSLRRRARVRAGLPD